MEGGDAAERQGARGQVKVRAPDEIPEADKDSNQNIAAGAERARSRTGSPSVA